jgi:PAS domain S-box-containing protein
VTAAGGQGHHVDSERVTPALVSVEEAARAVVQALANHGPAGVYAAGVGPADHRLLAGDDLLADGLADGPIVEVHRAGREGSLLLVAPDAPASARQLAVTALAAASDAAAARAVLDRTHREAHAAATRFESLVAAAPDAIIVVGTDGRISAVNPQAGHLLGYGREALVGLDVDDLLPDAVRSHHAALRRGYMTDAHPRPMGAGLDLEAKRSDGTLVPVDIGLTPIETDDGPAVAAFVRDATPRRQAEADRQRFAEGRLRRRQALELNDTVVQGLVALLWRLEDGDAGEAQRIATATLAAARRIMADLLSDDLDDLDPHHLVRSEHAGTTAPRTQPAPPAPSAPTRAPGTRARTVLIADDAADLRYLLRFRLERGGVHVIAEAADGQRAVELALQHRPEVVLLDLSMPVLDGLEAARRIRAALPDVTIVVLSGYPDEVMGQRALSAGADAYCEKTVTLDEVYEAVTGAPATSRP